MTVTSLHEWIIKRFHDMHFMKSFSMMGIIHGCQGVVKREFGVFKEEEQ